MTAWLQPKYRDSRPGPNKVLFHDIQLSACNVLVVSETCGSNLLMASEIIGLDSEEIAQKRRKVFPVRLMDIKTFNQWLASNGVRREKLVTKRRDHDLPDFSNWKDPDAFEAAFKQLQQAFVDESAPQIAGPGRVPAD